MTLDEAVALSLLPAAKLPRLHLLERLRAADPELIDAARRCLDAGRNARARAAQNGVDAVAWNDARFPSALLAIGDAPPVLWYRGVLDVLDAPAVAIVGSRAASPVALETSERLAADLAARGIIVVSGLARGVDSAAPSWSAIRRAASSTPWSADAIRGTAATTGLLTPRAPSARC